VKRLILVLCLLPAPAFAGSIAIQFTSGIGSATKTYTVADADLQRLVTAYQSDCNVRINGTCTLGQVLTQIALDAKAAWVAKTRAAETAAAQATLPLVTDVPLN
jgi:hypothetical protein